MKLEQFTSSFACRSGVHCLTCRDRERGRTFRLRAVGVDAFECPHGNEWDCSPCRRAIPLRVVATRAGGGGKGCVDWKRDRAAAHWARLHTWAASLPAGKPIDPAPVDRWLKEWERGIRCDHCRVAWSALRKARPVDCTSGAAVFRWSVDIHNDVSVQHANKPPMDHAAAAARWA